MNTLGEDKDIGLIVPYWLVLIAIAVSVLYFTGVFDKSEITLPRTSLGGCLMDCYADRCGGSLHNIDCDGDGSMAVTTCFGLCHKSHYGYGMCG